MEKNETGFRPSAESVKDKSLRNFTGEVYQNVPQSKHAEVSKVAKAVFEDFMKRYGTFGPRNANEAMRVVISVLNGEMEIPEPNKEVEKTSDNVRKEVSVTAGADVVSPVKPQVASCDSRASESVNSLPVVHLTTDMRDLAAKVYSVEEMHEHNPFNGVGAMEDLRAFEPDDNEVTKFPKTVQELNAHLHMMVAKGASMDEVNAEVVKAVEKNMNIRDVLQALQDAYNHTESTRASG